MKKYARIENGKVAELFETDGDISTMFHPSLFWVECTGEVQVDDNYQDGVFTCKTSIHIPAIPFSKLAHDYMEETVMPLREQILSRLVGIGFDALCDGNSEIAASVKAARQSIIAVIEHPAVAAAIAEEDFKALHNGVKQAYAEAIAAADPVVVEAFRGMGL